MTPAIQVSIYPRLTASQSLRIRPLILTIPGLTVVVCIQCITESRRFYYFQNLLSPDLLGFCRRDDARVGVR